MRVDYGLAILDRAKDVSIVRGPYMCGWDKDSSKH